MCMITHRVLLLLFLLDLGRYQEFFFPFYDESKSKEEWEQTDYRQINYLDELREYFPVMNGYVVCRDDLPSFPDKNSQEYENLLSKVKIGYHSHVEVTFDGFSEKCKNKNQFVDQAVCAAMNVGQGMSGYRNKNLPDCAKKCKFILQGDYEATYLSAIIQKKKTIFLTLLGGGVFGNRDEWIYEEIMNAHKKYANTVGNCIENVIVVGYNMDSLNSSFRTMLRDNNVSFKYMVYSESEELEMRDSFGI